MLFVCTGNICRSPAAERLSRSYLDAALGADAHVIDVESAGTRPVVGAGVQPDSARVLISLGGDADGFAARQLTDDMAINADLTLALSRNHRRAVLERAPRALSRTFTLVEAVDLVSLVGAAGDLPGEALADRCRVLVKEMAAARAWRASDGRDDIPDPVGRPLGFHREVVEAIAGSAFQLFSRFAELRSAEESTGSHAVAYRRGS